MPQSNFGLMRYMNYKNLTRLNSLTATDNFKRTFGILEFSQKTNERIRFYYYNEFVRSFFGRIRGHQNVLSKLSDL